MVNVNKALQNRAAALKYMQDNTRFRLQDVATQFKISPVFLTMAKNKAIITKKGNEYIWSCGTDANIKMASALRDEERNYFRSITRNRATPKSKFAVKEVKETPMLSKAIDTQVEYDTKENFDTPFKGKHEKTVSISEPVEQELTVKIKNGKVIMDWEDFGKLLCKQ